jgi:hypothetical protein
LQYHIVASWNSLSHCTALRPSGFHRPRSLLQAAQAVAELARPVPPW